VRCVVIGRVTRVRIVIGTDIDSVIVGDVARAIELVIITIGRVIVNVIVIGIAIVMRSGNVIVSDIVSVICSDIVGCSLNCSLYW